MNATQLQKAMKLISQQERFSSVDEADARLVKLKELLAQATLEKDGPSAEVFTLRIVAVEEYKETCWPPKVYDATKEIDNDFVPEFVGKIHEDSVVKPLANEITPEFEKRCLDNASEIIDKVAPVGKEADIGVLLLSKILDPMDTAFLANAGIRTMSDIRTLFASADSPKVALKSLRGIGNSRARKILVAINGVK